MRRLASPLLVGAGVFLLALAVLLPTLVVPRLEEAPVDIYSVTRATGTGSYYDAGAQEFVTDDEIEVTRVVRGDVEASGEDVGVYDFSQTVQPSQLEDPFHVVLERIVLDRSTGAGTGGRGDRPSHEDAYTIKLPFGTERRDYQVHEPAVGDAFPVSFQRETEVDGLTVYEFRGEVPEQVVREISLPGELLGAPDERSVFAEEVYVNPSRTFLVEPRTGSIVSSTSAPRRFFRPVQIGGGSEAEETTVFEAELAATEESVSELVADAQDAKSSLTLLGTTLPLVLGILGLLALAAGLLLLARSRRDTGRGAHTAEYSSATY